MDKNRYETQKHVVEVNLEDAPQQFFTREDLHWLFTQAEKVVKLEDAIKGLGDKWVDSQYKLQRYEKALKTIVEKETVEIRFGKAICTGTGIIAKKKKH